MTQQAEIPGFDLSRIREVTGGGSRRFWSSLEELLDEQGFRAWLSAEFPAAASMFDDPGRRQFLKLMGASLLLAGLSACGDGKSEQALPYVTQPDNIIPGVPRYYATGVMFDGYVQPVIATTYAGRPTKLDGNPEHPVTRGASDVFMQSALFELYDPERSKIPLRDGTPSTWTAFTGATGDLRTRWRERQGEGLRILTGPISSPTLIRQFGDLAKQFPKMRWSQFAPAAAAQEAAAMMLNFGRPVALHLALDSCDVIISLGHDLLGPGPHQVMRANAWARLRGEVAPGEGRSRLHVAESLPSLTGTVASTRLAIDPDRIAALAHALAAEFKVEGFSQPQLDAGERNWLGRAVRELRERSGHSLLTIGPQFDPHLQAIAPLVNARLNNVNATVWYSEPILSSGLSSQPVSDLAAEMESGAVDTLVVLDCNPVYASPGSLKLHEHIARVPNRLHAGLHPDETAQLCQWHLPLSHTLESWSDGRTVDGSVSIIQPVLAPIYASRSIHQLADLLLGVSDPAADAAVRATWQAAFGSDFEERWTRALHDGFVADTAARPLTLTARGPAGPIPDKPPATDPLQIVFKPDPCIWDGRFANIAWLQELPKPLTKITWDNAIEISPAIASEYKISNGDIAEVMVAGRRVRGAAWIVPGQAARSIALTFGYGRRAGGDIALGSGYDAYSVRPDEKSWLASGTIARISGEYRISTTQAHHRIDGFDLVREVTAKNPRMPAPKDQSTFYPDWNGEQANGAIAEHAWGMVIDLDLCIGCNACVSACNVENNVLVVGKDQVARGREMLWLRVDRYFTGEPENPRTYFQPVPCMHCEKAPCEMGCPVHATAHSPEGVNQMVYNRCIGTRTCSSYCPYKVRRFNWYDYRHFAEAEQAVKNPDVTVRSRGVMEKCTYCTQRIEAAHVAADKDNRSLRRDEIVTACQQACPTKAIVFGDLKDDSSAVAQRRRSGRHYVLLEELGTRPRTTYLARWNDSQDEGGA